MCKVQEDEFGELQCGGQCTLTKVSHCLIISFPNCEAVISFYFTDQITLKIKTKLSDYLFRWSHYETTTEKVQRCILLNVFVLIYKTDQQPSCLHSKPAGLVSCACVCVCKCAQSAAFVTYTLGQKSRFASYTFAISDALIIFQLHMLNF